jgi:alpha-glucosidase
VALNSTGGATGAIYIDDGVSIEPNATREVTLTAIDGMLNSASIGNYSVAQPLGNVTVLGVEQPKKVSFTGGSCGWSWTNNTLLVNGFDNVSAWDNPWIISWQ